MSIISFPLHIVSIILDNSLCLCRLNRNNQQTVTSRIKDSLALDFIVVEESSVFSPVLVIQCSVAFLDTVFPESFVPKVFFLIVTRLQQLTKFREISYKRIIDRRQRLTKN